MAVLEGMRRSVLVHSEIPAAIGRSGTCRGLLVIVLVGAVFDVKHLAAGRASL
jgi:hypothetical protein